MHIPKRIDYVRQRGLRRTFRDGDANFVDALDGTDAPDDVLDYRHTAERQDHLAG
jgi:hypothetical protein